eukprot:186302_1
MGKCCSTVPEDNIYAPIHPANEENPQTVLLQDDTSDSDHIIISAGEQKIHSESRSNPSHTDSSHHSDAKQDIVIQNSLDMKLALQRSATSCAQNCEEYIQVTSVIANTDVYTNNNCNTDVTKCESIKRIQMVLNVSTLSTNNNENKEIPVTKLESFINDKYTIIQLVNDYDHIKYGHKVDNDDNEFAKVYAYFTQNTLTICNIHNCKYIDRHYMNRSKLISQSISNENSSRDNCIINLITKMHVYFIHSYDINRRTVKEKQNIEQQHSKHVANNDEKQINDNLLDNNMIKITLPKISKTKSRLKIDAYAKYIESTHCIDFQNIHQLLSHHNIFIDVKQIQIAFIEYENKNQFIHDLIDAYYSTSDRSLPLENKISVNHLPQDYQIRHQIYGILLFKYIRKHELNNDNFVKIAAEIIKISYQNIDVNEFTQIAIKQNLNGKMFIKGDSCFKNSVNFAKLFASINGYTKKTFTQIYVILNKWYIDPNVQNIRSTKIDVSATQSTLEENKQNTMEQGSIEDVVYKIGTRFFYWESMKNHPLYIQAKHSNLKTELLQSQVIGSEFDPNMWNQLDTECEIDLKRDVVKIINGNGYFQQIYNIRRSAIFSASHLMGLKLYTDYTKLCSILCSTLRSENKNKICQIANWIKLLSECVQCYGTSLNASKWKRYYRGVQNVFTFTMLVTRFNLPTSTTHSFLQAVQFCDDGLVLELKHYRNTYDVFKFDCSALSVFDIEKE